MKKIYLHIGLHKTGSTSLQSFLCQNKDSLLRNGYLHPHQGLSAAKRCHHNLAWQATSDHRFDQSLGSFQSLRNEIELSSADKVIISSEDFSRAQLNEIKYIRSELNSYNIKIVVYIKRQDLRVQSVYSQLVKNGFYFKSIDDFIDSAKSKFDYYSLLQPWQNIFGIENIIVRPLEKAQIKDIFCDFISVIGMDNCKDFLPIERNLNISPGKSLLETIRFINNLLFKKYKTKCIFNDNNYKKITRKFIRQNIQDSENKHLISYDCAVNFLQQFETSNRKLAKEYLRRENHVLFYEQPTPYSINPTNIDYLNNHDIQNLIIRLLTNAERSQNKLKSTKNKLEIV